MDPLAWMREEGYQIRGKNWPSTGSSALQAGKRKSPWLIPLLRLLLRLRILRIIAVVALLRSGGRRRLLRRLFLRRRLLLRLSIVHDYFLRRRGRNCRL